MSDMSLTQRYCDVLHRISYDNLSDKARRSARRLILDGLSVAVAGVNYPGPNILRETLGTPPGPCTLIGTATRVDPLVAARANGAAMHVLDFEAMWSPANHATSTCLPAILAAAQISTAAGKPVDGKTILAAYVAGVEAQQRVRLASGLLEPRNFSFHPPGQVGPLGGAVGAAHVLGLDALQLRHAVGIAASSCGSLMANAGSMTKAMHTGNAAANGLLAALLASRGFTSNLEILDVAHGYIGNLVPHLDVDHLCHTDRPLMIDSPGFAIKLFPSQYGTHFGINAALDAHKLIADPREIVAADLYTPDMGYIDRALPRTGLEGKFSFQYTVAVGLMDGRVVIDSFSDAWLARPELQALLPNVKVHVDRSRPAGFEEMEVRLVVRLRDGSQVETVCTAPRGYRDKGAAVSDAEIEAKARDCLSRRLDAGQVEHAVAILQKFDTLDAAAIEPLFGLLQH